MNNLVDTEVFCYHFVFGQKLEWPTVKPCSDDEETFGTPIWLQDLNLNPLGASRPGVAFDDLLISVQ
jgi:hypothetical protein